MIYYISALVSIVLSIGFGIGLVFLSVRYMKVKGALLVAVLFAPAVLYLGLSGRLVEFKGLGFEAKFKELAKKTIVPTSVVPIASSASDIQSISKAKALMGIGSEVVLLQASTTDLPITHERVLEFALKIYPGLLQGNFELLVVVDSTHNVLGYFSREFFFDLLRIEIEQSLRGARERYDSSRVREQIEQTQLWDIVEYPKMRAESWGAKLLIQSTDTNATALKRLTEANQEAAVVVTTKGSYAGIVRRADIVAELLSALAGSNASIPTK